MACKYYYKDKVYSEQEFKDYVLDNIVKKSPENQFMSLLQKDNNWVRFFIQSIIQDSAKKGYENVRFPLGDTIIQIESAGRFKSYEEADEYYSKNDNWKEKVKELDEEIKEIQQQIKDAKDLSFEEYKYKNNIKNTPSKNTEEEIKRLEKFLINTKEERQAATPNLLKTAQFYENTVANILKKDYKEGVKEVTDEYGNKWLEVKLDKLDTDIQFKKSEESKEEKPKSAFTKQEIYFSNRIKTLTKQRDQHEEGSKEYDKLNEELETFKLKFNTAQKLQSQELFKELGEEVLAKIGETIDNLENFNSNIEAKIIEHALDVINTFKDFKDLRDTSYNLLDRLKPFIDKFKVDLIQEYATETIKPELKDIENQNEDISKRIETTGSLSDLANYIGRTIGSIINFTQNKVETYTKQVKKRIEKEIKILDDYAKKNGATLEEIYELFIQPSNNTLGLVQPFFDNGKENPNWEKVQNTKELRDFYNFYLELMNESTNGLPINLGKNFIPNISKQDFKSKLKNSSILKTRTIKEGYEEENLADVVPLEYHKPLPASQKSTNLGVILFEFSKYAYNQKEMSDILPSLRLLQESLTYEVVNGNYIERQFKSSNDPGLTIPGRKTNLYNMIDKVIEMQVKGKMKLTELNFVISETTDKDGNTIQTVIDGAKGVDLLLKFNSLLRIGLSPITAVTNWLFGDISNLIEAIGGQFFTVKDLTQASNIFFKQNFDKNSVLNKLLEELNPLQELTDYELKNELEAIGEKKLTPEKIQEIMYSLQTSGEKFLQSRTMIALMINQKYLTSDGKLTDKYNNLSDLQKQELASEIKRLNQKIHGRYTQKEAAILQQNVYFRLISQFRKWIFSAIENRINKKQYDNRLKAEIEGSYRTFGRLVLSNWKEPGKAFTNLLLPLIDSKRLLEEGRMSKSEIYNMRKMATEIISIGVLTALYMFLHGGDDDKDRRKLPQIKLALTLLDRASGDLAFFYSPEKINELGKNAIPLSKTVGDILQAMYIIPEVLVTGDYTIKKGSSKGRNRIAKEFSDIIPLAKPLFELYKIGRRDVSLEEQR